MFHRLVVPGHPDVVHVASLLLELPSSSPADDQDDRDDGTDPASHTASTLEDSRLILISLHFGCTEVQVSAQELHSGEPVHRHFRFAST
jgi:hypothetical protein